MPVWFLVSFRLKLFLHTLLYFFVIFSLKYPPLFRPPKKLRNETLLLGSYRFSPSVAEKLVEESRTEKDAAAFQEAALEMGSASL